MDVVKCTSNKYSDWRQRCESATELIEALFHFQFGPRYEGILHNNNWVSIKLIMINIYILISAWFYFNIIKSLHRLLT